MQLSQKRKLSITDGPILSRMILFILPVMATNFLHTFYNAADIMVVGLSGEGNAVGAIGTTASFVSL